MPTRDELTEILRLHRLWVEGRTEGRRADLRGANLQGANLQGADLRDANLQGANLQGADLRRADLQGANLQGANLQGANLQGAYLQGAYLRGANLQGAYLQGANIWPNWVINSYRDLLWVGPLGSRNDWLLVNVPTLRVQTGCFEGPLDAFLVKVEETHADSEYGREYRATAEYLKALFTARMLESEAVPA